MCFHERVRMSRLALISKLSSVRADSVLVAYLSRWQVFVAAGCPRGLAPAPGLHRGAKGKRELG